MRELVVGAGEAEDVAQVAGEPADPDRAGLRLEAHERVRDPRHEAVVDVHELGAVHDQPGDAPRGEIVERAFDAPGRGEIHPATQREQPDPTGGAFVHLETCGGAVPPTRELQVHRHGRAIAVRPRSSHHPCHSPPSTFSARAS